MRRFYGKAKSGVSAGGMLNEAMSLVQGDYLEFLITTRQAIPGWAWLNPLAHRSVPRIVQMAKTTNGEFDPSGWSGALSSLAAQVIGLGRTVQGVERLQRDVLIPLESSLLAGEYRWPSSPIELVELVESVLEQHGTLAGS